MKHPGMGETQASLPADSPALTPTLPVADGQATDDEGLPEVGPTRYQLANEIGRGGIGRVLKAQDTVLRRTIAIKELHAADEGTRQRFVREALITARLQHPSIVPVYEAGRRDGAPFYAMKLVAGQTLGDAIKAATTLPARLALVPNVLAVADAIAYAHGERIVHRDLKPQNVLLGGFGETVVIDWGLAKDLAAADGDATPDGPDRTGPHDAAHTIAGAVLGTPAYMSPEQAQGRPVDERTDVYALGAMLYHVIAGVIPHEGDSVEAITSRILSGDIVPITERSPDAPADLATIVGKAMARDPAGRYPTARELAEDLRRFQTGQLVGAHRYTLGERVRRWLRRYRAVVAAGGIALAVLIVLGVASIRRIVVERRRADELRVVAQDKARSSAEANNRAVLAQARSALERDPAEALAWLASFDSGGPGWESARVVALGALARPRPDRIMSALSRDSSIDARGNFVVVSSARAVWLGNLETQAFATYAITSATFPTICDDGAHVVGYGKVGGADVYYSIATADFDLAVEPLTQRQSLERRAACARNTRFFPDAGAIWVWDGSAAQKLGPAGDQFRGVYNTRDGTHALSMHGLGTITRWSQDGSSEVHVLPMVGPDRMAWTTDGRTIAVAIGKTTELWDMTTGTKLAFEVPAERVAIAPDGRWIAATDGRSLQILTPTGELRRKVSSGKIEYLYSSPDGRWLVGGADEVTVWNVDAPVPMVLAGHTSAISGDFASDDQLVTMDVFGRIRRWPLVAPEGTLPGPITASARSPDQRFSVMVTPAKVRRRHAGVTDEADLPRESGGVPMRVAVDHDGSALLAEPHGMTRWPIGGAIEPSRMHDNTQIFPEGLHPAWSKGRPLTWNGESLVIWEASGPRVIAAPTRKNSQTSGDVHTQRLVVSPDGRWAAAGQLEGMYLGNPRTIVLYDLDSGRVDALPDSRCELAAFTRDSKLLVTGNIEGKVIVWDVATRTPRQLGTGDQRASVAAISPDGRRIAVAGTGDIVIATFDGQPSKVLKSTYDEPIRLVQWSTSGDTLAVATEADVRFIDVAVDLGWTMSVGPVAIDVVGDAFVITTSRREYVVADVLPRDEQAVAAWLKTIPYRIGRNDRVTTEPDR